MRVGSVTPWGVAVLLAVCVACSRPAGNQGGGSQAGGEQGQTAATAPAGEPGTTSGTAGGPATGGTGDSGGKDAVMQAHAALLQALQNGDANGIEAMLSTGPQLLLFAPLTEERFDSVDKVRQKLPNVLAGIGKASVTEAHTEGIVEDGAAWITYNFGVESPNLKEPIVGRATEIWIKEGGNWRLVHGHWSRRPTPPDSGAPSGHNATGHGEGRPPGRAPAGG